MTTTTDIRRETDTHEHAPVSDLALWTAVLIGPVIFLVNLQVNYTMVDWACNTGHGWALHIAHAVSFLVIAAGLVLGTLLWRRVGGGWPDPGGGSVSRARLLAVVGTLGSALSLVSLIAHWIPVMILGPCPRA